eukprot:CAMPEP_0119311568 /NCGR_PEP_ID=MMETSP1333-20130426/22988_1 /TAXON_ID=418940 /ORGANISM="Scyphosphaera apsteinii, Strain RCC1455" /LENGTH=349 /DNA_ID=CAMNT_0007315987 /DNA_START=115 /DNA_END=1164 /DNA_ORIENTATION=+
MASPADVGAGGASLSTVEGLLKPEEHRPHVRSTRRRRYLPTVRVSAEYLDDLFAKFHIYPSQVTTKTAVSETNDIRQTLTIDDVEGIVGAVAEALSSHLEAELLNQTSREISGSSDFEDETSSHGDDVSPHEVMLWLHDAIRKLSLDIECLIMCLIFVERAIFKRALCFSWSTWRNMTLVAVAVAAKTWYDGAVYNADVAKLLPGCELKQFNKMEGIFLAGIDFEVNVPLSLFAKYLFALHDVIRYKNGGGHFSRRRTWGPGEHYFQCLSSSASKRSSASREYSASWHESHMQSWLNEGVNDELFCQLESGHRYGASTPATGELCRSRAACSSHAGGGPIQFKQPIADT